jgi:hypothetical protein
MSQDLCSWWPSTKTPKQESRRTMAWATWTSWSTPLKLWCSRWMNMIVWLWLLTLLMLRKSSLWPPWLRDYVLIKSSSLKARTFRALPISGLDYTLQWKHYVTLLYKMEEKVSVWRLSCSWLMDNLMKFLRQGTSQVFATTRINIQNFHSRSTPLDLVTL